MANSAQIVFPQPADAPRNTLSSVLYNVLKTKNEKIYIMKIFIDKNFTLSLNSIKKFKII